MNNRAIFIGSIAEGFAISQIVAAAEAENIVKKHLANGQIAEAVEVQKPSSVDKREKDFDSGMDFVVFGSGLGDGFTLYGPFPDWETSHAFGERHCAEDEEWENFQFDAPGPVQTDFDIRFDALFNDAFDGLREFYPSLTDEVKLEVKAAVSPNYPNSGNDQDDYQCIRDAIEALDSVSRIDRSGDAAVESSVPTM